MDWLRWPTDDTDPHSYKALQENVLKENEGQEEALDLAMALVDQSDLYARLKMKPLYPELMQTEEVEEETREETREEGGAAEQDSRQHGQSCHRCDPEGKESSEAESESQSSA